MATIGILGQIDISAATITDIYTVPASTKAIFNVIATNRGSVVANVRVSLSATSVTMANKEYVLYDFSLSPAKSKGCVVTLTGLELQAGKYVIGYSDVANVSFNVNGIEEAV